MEIPLPKNFTSIQANEFNLRKFQQEEIISLDWQLRKPAYKKGGNLIFSFLQGLSISISPGKIIFAKKITNNTVDLVKIVQQFISKFNHYHYSRSQIVLRRFITLPNQENCGAKFIQNHLLNGLQWEVLGKKPIKRQINYFYQNHLYDLNINVLDLPIRNKKIESKSCLFFRGIFEYKPNLDQKKNPNNYFLAVIEKYSENISIFNQIVENDLLNN